MAYCSSGDLMLGSIPLPAYLDTDKAVEDAADEIDSKIGLIYETPVEVLDTNKVSRPVKLFFKRTNAMLASGRLLLAIASPEEQRSLHAYAYSLVKEATDALTAIASGEVQLDIPLLNPDSTVAVTAPQIDNLDSESNVEAFYNRIANPAYSYAPYDYRRFSHDGFVG